MGSIVLTRMLHGGNRHVRGMPGRHKHVPADLLPVSHPLKHLGVYCETYNRSCSNGEGPKQ